MGGRGSSSGRAQGIDLLPGANDPELTDAISDYYLPADVRAKLGQISQIKTYNDLQAYLGQNGIELDTDVDSLKGSEGDNVHPAIAEQAQKIAVAVETYKSTFGNDSLKALKRVKVYDKSLDTTGAFHYNEKGENDPLAGTMRIRDWSVSGHDIYHELAHAMQTSRAKSGEDTLQYSDRIMKKYGKKLNVKYSGNNSKVYNAEVMAESISNGFTQGGSEYVDLINYLRKRK